MMSCCVNSECDFDSADFCIKAGSTWPVRFDVLNTNLTGYTARMWLERFIGQTPPDLALTTENGGLTIVVDTSGEEPISYIYMSVPPATTAMLVYPSYFYDLKIQSPDGNEYPILQGKVLVAQERTP